MSEPVRRSAEEAARVSDALQAAYFRDLLTVKRAQLDAGVAGMRRQLEMSAKTGNRFETNRLHFLVRQHQNELSHLDWLVGRLERRFTDAWAGLDGELG